MAEESKSQKPPGPEGSFELDPVFLQSRREAGGILAIWAFFFLWVIGSSAFLAYENPLDATGQVRTFMGMPTWVFWSVALPWFTANLVIVWFTSSFMKREAPQNSIEPLTDQPDTH